MVNEFNYELLLKTLLGSDTSFTLQIENNNIHISSRSEEQIQTVQERLKKNLNSSAELAQTLKYRLSSVTADQQHTVTPAVTAVAKPMPQATAEQVRTLLTTLINPELLEDNGVSLRSIFNDKTATEKEGVIFSKEIKDEDLAKVLNHQMAYVMRFFNNIALAEIHDILENKTHFLPEPEELALGAKATAAHGLLQECIGLQQFEQPLRVVAYFNFKRFWQFLYPPEVSFVQTDETTYSITLDIEHLIARLKSLMQSSVLLKIFKDSDQKHYALPIPLGLEPSAKKQASYCIVIDKSGSLDDNEQHMGAGGGGAALRTQAIAFLNNLAQKCDANNESRSDTFVSLVFFDHNTHRIPEMTLDKLDELSRQIENITFSGGTSLCAAIQNVFTDVTERQLTTDRQHTIILFTDGAEQTLSRSETNTLLSNIFSDYQRHGLELPQFYTFGYGAKQDTDILQQISNFTHTQYTSLPKVEDFSRILNNYAAEMTKRDIVEILGTLAGQRHVFSVPVYGNLGPQMPRVIIPLHNSTPLTLTQSGKGIAITFDDQNIPELDITGKLAKIGAQIATIISHVNPAQQAFAIKPWQEKLLALKPAVEQSSNAAKVHYNELVEKVMTRTGSFTASAQVGLVRPSVNTGSVTVNTGKNNTIKYN